MSTEIDRRVVEMQFDNKDFERNVQTSLTTIEKLKMALNFDGAKGLDSITKAADKVDMSNIVTQTQKVQVSFSALQIAGATMVSELTKSFMNFGKNLWNSSIGQAKSGGMARALKIEQANFKMQALAKNIDQVKNGLITAEELIAQMAKAIDDSVTGTAYGYDSAANVASQLMASGLTDSKRMYTYLRGIAGAAAMTGRSFDDIGNIFSTVSSNGKLMLQQVRQFSASGLNVMATLGQQMGKTEQQISEMISKGKIGFEDFAQAMYDAFGESAGKADETYAGVLSNVKAQLSRLGQRFAVPYIENMIPFLQKLKAAIKQISATLAPIADRFDKIFGRLTRWGAGVLENIDYQKFTIVFRGIENLAWSVVMVFHTLKDAFDDVFQKKTREQILEAAKNFERLTEQILPTEGAIKGLKGLFTAILTPVKVVLKVFSTLTKHTKPIMVALLKVAYAVTSIFQVLEPLALGFIDFIDKLGLLDAVLNIVSKTIVYVVSLFEVLVIVIAGLIKAIAESDRIKKIGNDLKTVGLTIASVIVRGLTKVLELISDIFAKVNNNDGTSFLSRMQRNLALLWGTVVQLVESFGFWLNSMDSAKGFKSIINIIREFFDLIHNFLVGNDVEGNINGISNSFKNLGDAIKECWAKFKEQWDNIDKGTLVMALFAMVMISLMLSIKNLIDTTTGFVSSMKNVSGILSDIRKAIQNLGNFAGPAQTILAFAGAVAVVTNSLITLSKVEEKGSLTKVAVILGSLMTIILGFTLAIEIFSKKVVADEQIIDRSAMNLIAITGSIWLLVAAIKSLANLEADTTKIMTSIVAIIVLMGSMIAAMWAIKKYTPEMVKGTMAFITFATSIMILTKAIDIMDKIEFDHMTDTLASLGTLIIAFGLAIGTAGKASGWAALAISAFTFSVITLFGMFLILAYIPMETIEAAIVRTTNIFKMFIPLIITVGVASKLASGGAKVGAALSGIILSLTVFLMGFVAFVRLTKGIDMGGAYIYLVGIIGLITAAVAGITVIEALISEDAKNSREVLRNANGAKATFDGIAKIIGSLAICMLSIGIAARLMNGVNIGALGMIAAYIAELGVIAIVLQNMSDSAKPSKSNIMGLVALLGSLGIVVGALIAFQFADPEKLIIGAETLFFALSGIAILMAGLGIYKEAADKSKLGKSKKSTIKDMIGTIAIFSLVASIVAGVAAALIIVKDVPKDNLIAFGAFVTILTVVMGVMVSKFAGMPSDDYKNALKGIGSVALLIVGIAALAGIMKFLATIPATTSVVRSVGQMATIVGAMVILAITLGVFTKVMKKNNVDGRWIKENAISLNIACLAFVTIAGSLALLQQAYKDCDTGDLLHNTIAIGALFGEMAIALGVLSKFGKGTYSDMHKVSGSMALMSAGIIGIASAFAILKKSGASVDDIYGYVGALSILMLAFSGMSVLLALFEPATGALLAIAAALASFGVAAASVGADIFLVAQSIHTLADMTEQDIDRVVDSIIHFLGRFKEIEQAFADALPHIFGAVQMLFIGVGELVGALIGNITATAIVAFVAALVANIDVILAGVYIILRKIVDFLLRDDVQQLIEDTFAVLAKSALRGLAGLFDGVRELLREIDNITVEEIIHFSNKDLVDLDSWNLKFRSMMNLYQKYASMDNMSEVDKENFERLKQNINELIAEFDNHKWAYTDINDKITGNIYKTQHGRLATLYEHVRQQFGDDNYELYQQFIEDLDDTNSESYAALFNQYRKDYNTDWGSILTAFSVEKETEFMNAFGKIWQMDKDYRSHQNDIKATELQLEIATGACADFNKEANRTGIVTAGAASDIEDLGDSFYDTSESMEESDNWLSRWANNVAQRRKEVEEEIDNSGEVIENSIKTHVNDAGETINDFGEVVDDLTGGYDKLSYTTPNAIVAPKINKAAFAAINGEINMVKEGMKGLNVAMDNVNVTSDEISDAGDETDEFKQAEERAADASERVAQDIANLGKEFDGLNLSVAGVNVGFNDLLGGFKTVMSAAGLDTSWMDYIDQAMGSNESSVKTADYWREYWSELVNIYEEVGEEMVVIGTKARWAAEDYASLEEAVNDSVKAGEEAHNNIWGSGIEEKADEILKKTQDAIMGNADALGDLADAEGYAADYTDKLKDSIESTLDVFTEFNKEVKLTGREILANFYSQIDGVQSWQKELEELASRGMNKNFLNQLAEEGPKAYDRIHAFYNMTEAEMTLFNTMYAQKLMIQRSSQNQIRKTFVATGNMMENELDKFETSIDEQYNDKLARAQAKAANSKAGTIAESTQKSLDSMYEEIEKYEADTEFIEQWKDNIGSSSVKLDLMNAFSQLGYSSIDAFAQSMNFQKVMEKILQFKQTVKEQVKSSLNLFDEVKEVEEKDKMTTTEILNNMEENLKRVGGWSNNLKKMIKMGFSEGLIEELRQMGPESAEKVEAFVKMTAAEVKMANRYWGDSVQLPESISDRLTDEYAKAGFEISLGLKKGLDEGSEDFYEHFRTAGEDASQGYVDGIDSEAANEAMDQLGQNTLDRLMTKLDEHSPSREMMKIGMNAVAGYLIGLKRGIKGLGTFTNELGSKVMDGFTKNISFTDTMSTDINDVLNTMTDKLYNVGNAASMIDMNDIYEPVIRPVWDTTAIENGFTTIDQLLSGKTISLKAVNDAAQRSGPSQDAVMITNAINNLYNEQRIIRGEINSINSNVASLGNRIDGMYVRLDGNALVGQIVSPMDKAMGKKVVTQKRGRV